MIQLRRKFSLKAAGKFLSLAPLFALALLSAPSAKAQVVLTVPWVPANPAAPHTTYPVNATTEAKIVLGAVFNPQTDPHSFVYSWTFGDGSSPTASTAVSIYNGIGEDISTTHQYPASAAPGTTWTATVTVTDTTTTTQYTGNYLVIQEANTLSSRVNVTLDRGLWYLHQNMYHPTATTGNWHQSCNPSYSGYSCGSGYGSLTATNVQAFEVNGHTATEADAASDPYAIDVAEGLASMVSNLYAVPLSDEWQYYKPEGVYYATYNDVKTYSYNPANANFGCSDGTAPTLTLTGTAPTASSAPAQGYCDASAVEVFYNPNATSCTAPPCNFGPFDANSNNYGIFAWQQSGDISGWGYEEGMYVDALVASGTPSATASIPIYGGGTVAESYQNVVQDMADATNFSQWVGDTDVTSGQERGYPYGDGYGIGGGWWYTNVSGNDNSTSQWASIGLIAAQRGFGISIPAIITDANNLWVTASQDVQSSVPTGADTWTGGYNAGSADGYGGFGYNGSLYYSNAWGAFAVTPSGMVQMSLDGIGRTNNTTFGAASNAIDQRFNNAETFYADNFCNPTTPGSYSVDSPRSYYYGMFSFTKAMLLHNPAGTLSPIQYLRTQTPGVFTTNGSVPANTIDWYAALSPTNGGTDPCDGVAQTIIDDQQPNTQGLPGSSYWYGDNYESAQSQYETAWSLIMLNRTVFVNCVNNLVGSGTKGNAINPAAASLSWTGIPNVTGYNILVSTTSGGPYTQVVYNGGTTTGTAFIDRSGLTNLGTYYFVLQPINASGAVCQSNQATVVIP